MATANPSFNTLLTDSAVLVCCRSPCCLMFSVCKLVNKEKLLKPSASQLCYVETQELRAGFEQEAATTGRERLLLTAAVPAGKSNIDSGYDIPEINKSVFVSTFTEILNSISGNSTVSSSRSISSNHGDGSSYRSNSRNGSNGSNGSKSGCSRSCNSTIVSAAAVVVVVEEMVMQQWLAVVFSSSSSSSL